MRNIIIDGIIFDILENVKTYSIDIETSVRKYTHYNSKADDNAKYYFLFEVGTHDAFSHWVFESAIFLQYLKRIEKELNRKLTLVIKKNPSRTYKSLFFKLLDVDNEITKEDNHYIDNKKDFVHSQQYTPYEIEENNICIGCRNLTVNNKNIDCGLLRKLLMDFHNTITANTRIVNKSIDNLILPRNTKENLVTNDRRIDYSKVYRELQNSKYISYNTMDTKDFNDQITLLTMSKNIFLDYGSSLWVNGFFCKDSNIYVLNDLGQHNIYKGWIEIIKVILSNNNKLINM